MYDKQDKGRSREEAFLNELLADAFVGKQPREALLEERVTQAVASLDELQQYVIKRRFGLDGFSVETPEKIAASLSELLTPALRNELAQRRRVFPARYAVSVEEIEEIEIAALRELRGSRRKR